jgi:hypothetical protein
MKRLGHSPIRVMESLSLPVVEDVFMRIAVDVQSLISLDGIDELPGQNGFRIRIHDLYGPLPDVQVQDLEDGSPLLEQIETEAAKRYVVARIRQNILQRCPEGQFLSPICTDKVYVGINLGGDPVMASGRDFLDAYDKLRSQVSEVAVLDA